MLHQVQPSNSDLADSVAGELAQRLSDSLRPHPRLIMTVDNLNQLPARLECIPEWSALWEATRQAAEGMLTEPPSERLIIGRRLLAVSRRAMARISVLAFVFRVTGQQEYFDRARSELLSIAAFTDYNPSHFLDVGEMIAGLAIGFDWLHDALSPDDRTVVREAIVNKGLLIALKCADAGWFRATNNWNLVCHGGLTMGALAVAEYDLQLSQKVIERAIALSPIALQSYAPDGAYPEGYMYWKYGTNYAVLLIASLESALGSDFGLLNSPGFLASANYKLHSVGPTGEYFNYSDFGNAQNTSPAAAQFYLAAKRKDASLLYEERQAVQRAISLGRSPLDRESVRFAPFLLQWATTELPTTPFSTHFVAGGETPVALHRTGWDKSSAFVGIKGGSASTSHSHLDGGTFVYEVLGVRWAIDLGSQDYHGLELCGIDLWKMSQLSDRWSVFRLGCQSHNILTFDAKSQAVDGSAVILRSSASTTVLDLSPLYPGQAQKVIRGVRLRSDGSLCVQDEITVLPGASHSVRWAMLTRAEVSLQSDVSALLQHGGKDLVVSVSSPVGSKIILYASDPKPNPFDDPNLGVSVIGFERTLPLDTQTLCVNLIPSTAGNIKHPIEEAVRPLYSW